MGAVGAVASASAEDRAGGRRWRARCCDEGHAASGVVQGAWRAPPAPAQLGGRDRRPVLLRRVGRRDAPETDVGRRRWPTRCRPPWGVAAVVLAALLLALALPWQDVLRRRWRRSRFAVVAALPPAWSPIVEAKSLLYDVFGASTIWAALPFCGIELGDGGAWAGLLGALFAAALVSVGFVDGLPFPEGTDEADDKMVDAGAAIVPSTESQGIEDDAALELRLDPADGYTRTFSFSELQQHCAGAYPPEDVLSYWRNTCRPLDSVVVAGSVCIVRVSSVVFASLDSWQQIGALAAGKRVVAAGPAKLVDGFLMVPIEPQGAVELVNLDVGCTSGPLDAARPEVGDWVRITQTHIVGRVRYIGMTHFSPGQWVGVECDRPVGKNDGSLDGHRYFRCPPSCGLFARAHRAALLMTYTDMKLREDLQRSVARAIEDQDFTSLRRLLPQTPIGGLLSTRESEAAWRIFDHQVDHLRAAEFRCKCELAELREHASLVQDDAGRRVEHLQGELQGQLEMSESMMEAFSSHFVVESAAASAAKSDLTQSGGRRGSATSAAATAACAASGPPAAPTASGAEAQLPQALARVAALESRLGEKEDEVNRLKADNRRLASSVAELERELRQPPVGKEEKECDPRFQHQSTFMRDQKAWATTPIVGAVEVATVATKDVPPRMKHIEAAGSRTATSPQYFDMAAPTDEDGGEQSVAEDAFDGHGSDAASGRHFATPGLPRVVADGHLRAAATAMHTPRTPHCPSPVLHVATPPLAFVENSARESGEEQVSSARRPRRRQRSGPSSDDMAPPAAAGCGSGSSAVIRRAKKVRDELAKRHKERQRMLALQLEAEERALKAKLADGRPRQQRRVPPKQQRPRRHQAKLVEPTKSGSFGTDTGVPGAAFNAETAAVRIQAAYRRHWYRRSLQSQPLQHSQGEDRVKEMPLMAMSDQEGDGRLELVADDTVDHLGMSFSLAHGGVVRVRNVVPGSWADLQGARPGTAVVAVNGLAAGATSRKAFKEALRTRPLFLSLELGPHIDLQRPDASVARILRSSDGEVAEHREDRRSKVSQGVTFEGCGSDAAPREARKQVRVLVAAEVAEVPEVEPPAPAACEEATEWRAQLHDEAQDDEGGEEGVEVAAPLQWAESFFDEASLTEAWQHEVDAAVCIQSNYRAWVEARPARPGATNAGTYRDELALARIDVLRGLEPPAVEVDGREDLAASGSLAWHKDPAQKQQAAVCIQAAYRGKVARRRVVALPKVSGHRTLGGVPPAVLGFAARRVARERGRSAGLSADFMQEDEGRSRTRLETVAESHEGSGSSTPAEGRRLAAPVGRAGDMVQRVLAGQGSVDRPSSSAGGAKDFL